MSRHETVAGAAGTHKLERSVSRHETEGGAAGTHKLERSVSRHKTEGRTAGTHKLEVQHHTMSGCCVYTFDIVSKLTHICGNGKRHIFTILPISFPLSSQYRSILHWDVRPHHVLQLMLEHSPSHSDVNTQFQITPLHSQQHQGYNIIAQCPGCLFKQFITLRVKLVHFFQKKISNT